MRLTAGQIKTSMRARAVGLRTVCGPMDELLGAVCDRVALLPAVRWAQVEGARARLEAGGAPTAEALAAMLIAELRPARRPWSHIPPFELRRTELCPFVAVPVERALPPPRRAGASGTAVAMLWPVAHGSVVASRSQSQAKRPT